MKLTMLKDLMLKKYYLPKGTSKGIIFNGENFYDQPFDSNMK